MIRQNYPVDTKFGKRIKEFLRTLQTSISSITRLSLILCCAFLLFQFGCAGTQRTVNIETDNIAFRKHVINADSEFIAACVFDVNHDGILDIACGGYWYEGPSWKKHFLRNVEILDGRPDGYAHQAFDVNGDSWIDIITINWRSRSVRWIENPGPELANEPEWKLHTVDVPGSMETGRITDILGDGTPCILVSTIPYWYELVREPDTAGEFTPNWIKHQLPREIAGHGVGFGDINGDGRGDIVGQNGWIEAPEDRREGNWIWHPDFRLGSTSIPILVVDVDSDGYNDLLYSMGHDYGIYWVQQIRTPDNQIKWIKHTIDTSWAGAHAPLWVDLVGDGTKDLVVGRRYLAHEGLDPGEYDPQAIYRYRYDPSTRTWHRFTISYNDDTGFGVDPVAIDLNGNGRMDLVFGGRHGLYWLENLGKGDSVAQHETHDPLWFPMYSDRLNLKVLKDESGQEKPIEDGFDIGQRRAQTLAALQAVMGTLPDSYQRVPLDVEVLKETPVDSYTRKKISYASDLDSRVSAYLLVPNSLRPNNPAMICLHDDTPLGKDEPAGLGGRDSMHYAEELVKRGYICLVPDYPSYGEDHYDLKKNTATYASGAMKAVWDNIRGIDLLQTIYELGIISQPTGNIGIIGHGLGGQNALLTAAFDCRIAAVISSCGITSFTDYRGGDLSDWADARRMPRIKEVYNNDPSKIPFDFAEVIAAVMPHPVFISAPTNDPVMDVESVKSMVNSAMSLYQTRNLGNSLHAIYPDSDRDFSDEVRTEAYEWLGN